MNKLKLIAICVVTAIGLSACAGAPDYDPTAFDDNNDSLVSGAFNFEQCGACGGWQQDWGHHHH